MDWIVEILLCAIAAVAGHALGSRTVSITFDDIEIEAPTMREALALLEVVKRSREKQ